MIKRVLASIGIIATASVAYVMLQPESIRIVDDGVVIEHETRADSVLEVLEELNITLDESDYVTPALSEDVPDDRLIRIERSHEVSLQIGYGQTETVQTRERT